MSQIKEKIKEAEDTSEKIYKALFWQNDTQNTKKMSDAEISDKIDFFSSQISELDKIINSTNNFHNQLLILKKEYEDFHDTISRKIFAEKFKTNFSGKENESGWIEIDLSKIDINKLSVKTGYFRFVFEFKTKNGKIEKKSLALPVQDIIDFQAKIKKQKKEKY